MTEAGDSDGRVATLDLRSLLVPEHVQKSNVFTKVFAQLEDERKCLVPIAVGDAETVMRSNVAAHNRV